LFPDKEASVSLTEQTGLEAAMLKTLTMSAAVSALLVSGALAQAGPPATSPPASPPPAKADAAPMDGAKFIASQGMDQWVFSKFKGTDVLGPDNAHIGDVNDLLFDKNGKILGMIVGVGGFLGIGEKSVAIDMGAFEAVPASTGASSDPTNVKLKVSWTKEQLQKAPDFQYYKPPSPSRTSDRPSGSPTTGMAR
jgi:hypothetical protein